MASTTFLSGAQTMLGACLLHHELDKSVERQRGSVEPLDRQRFDRLMGMDDDPAALFGMEMQGHPVAC